MDSDLIDILKSIKCESEMELRVVLLGLVMEVKGGEKRGALRGLKEGIGIVGSLLLLHLQCVCTLLTGVLKRYFQFQLVGEEEEEEGIYLLFYLL